MYAAGIVYVDVFNIYVSKFKQNKMLRKLILYFGIDIELNKRSNLGDLS